MRARFGRLQTTCASVPSALRIDFIVSNGHLFGLKSSVNHAMHGVSSEVRGVGGWDQLSHVQLILKHSFVSPMAAWRLVLGAVLASPWVSRPITCFLSMNETSRVLE